MMKTPSLNFLVLALSGLILTGCEFIGAIFGAGFYTGIFIVVLFLVLVILAVIRQGKRD